LGRPFSIGFTRAAYRSARGHGSCGILDEIVSVGMTLDD
jgi:hypothetical protein